MHCLTPRLASGRNSKWESLLSLPSISLTDHNLLSLCCNYSNSNNKNVGIYTAGRKDRSLRTGRRIDTRTFCLVTIPHHLLIIFISPLFGLCLILFLIAVDHTRVQLRDGDPTIPGSDYINANIISVSVSSSSLTFGKILVDNNFCSLCFESSPWTGTLCLLFLLVINRIEPLFPLKCSPYLLNMWLSAEFLWWESCYLMQSEHFQCQNLLPASFYENKAQCAPSIDVFAIGTHWLQSCSWMDYCILAGFGRWTETYPQEVIHSYARLPSDHCTGLLAYGLAGELPHHRDDHKIGGEREGTHLRDSHFLFFLCPSISSDLITLTNYLCVLQNKCVRYWPDEKEGTKDMEVYGATLKLQRVSETSTNDYQLREFELSRIVNDSVSWTLFAHSGIHQPLTPSLYLFFCVDRDSWEANRLAVPFYCLARPEGTPGSWSSAELLARHQW